MDPELLNTIYVATDIGVFVTSNGGTNWTPLGQDLPNVVVFDILMYQPTHTLRVITHGRGAWDAIVPLVGLQSNQASLTFASQTQGTTSAAQSVTLTNNLQSTSLSLTGFQVTGPFTQTNTCGATLASGASCTVNVAFVPTTAGNVYGALTASSSSNSVTIGLSGTGLGIPDVVLDSSSVSFSNQPVGIASAGQTVHLTNGGDAEMRPSRASHLRSAVRMPANSPRPIPAARELLLVQAAQSRLFLRPVRPGHNWQRWRSPTMPQARHSR